MKKIEVIDLRPPKNPVRKTKICRGCGNRIKLELNEAKTAYVGYCLFCGLHEQMVPVNE
jgi:hypothetical protein